MREKKRHTAGPWLACLLCCGLAVVPAPATGSDFDRELQIDAETVVLRNLIGRVDVQGHAGADFRIAVHVRGRDATPDRVALEIDEGREAELSIRFPLDESRRYVYPALGGGNASFHMRDGRGSWLQRLLGSSGDSIRVSGDGNGLEIWADTTVLVPPGATAVIDLGVGRIVARDVGGDLDLSTRSGDVDVTSSRGAVSIDTGAGDVALSDVDGKVNLDTGSGNVSLEFVRAAEVHVDTGSGEVDLESVDTSRLHVDTGSGGVEAHAVGADDLLIDTGSGSVTVALERMGRGGFRIDTGSGSVDLRLPATASATVRADSGTGGVRLDLSADHRVLRLDDDEVVLTVGDGAADVVLDTGSGSIRISQ